MITLDKIVLSVLPELITWNGNKRSYNSRYTNLPYHLYIAYNQQYRSYKVEFSAKILKDRYTELINRNNVRDCLNALNDVGAFSINVDRVINEAKVIGADFTKDVRLEGLHADNMADVKSIVRLSIYNYDRFNYANFKSGGIVVSNSVKNKRRRKRLTIYSKADELRLAENRPFLASLNDIDRLREYFSDRVRFELRATTQDQLRSYLEIRDLTIMNVLNSTSNPLSLVASEMFQPISYVDESIKPTLTNLDKLSTLKLLNWDLMRVEAHVRESTKRSVRDGMKQYERLYKAHRLSQSINLIDALRN